MTRSPAAASCALFLVLGLACRGAEVAGSGGEPGPRGGVAEPGSTAGPSRPTLEEIFLEPPISGHPPRLDSLSPDGAFCLVRWSPTEAEAADAPLRLLAVEEALRLGEPAGCGTPLEELLPVFPTSPAAEDERRVRETLWAGGLLVVARGPEVLLHDPRSGATRLAFLPPAPTPEAAPQPGSGADPQARMDHAEGAEAAQQDGAREPVRGPREVRRLELSGDGTRLVLGDRAELWSLPVPEGIAGAPLAWEELVCHSAEVAADASRLSWSDDLSVVFGRDPAPDARRSRGRERAEEEDEDEDGGSRRGDDGDEDVAAARDADEPDEPPLEHVLHLREGREGRATRLEGLDELRWFEGAALSPDGSFVFGIEADRAHEPSATLVPDYLSERVSVRRTRSLLADDGPAPLVLWMWDTRTGARTPVGPFGPPEPPEPATDDAAPAPDDADAAPDGGDGGDGAGGAGGAGAAAPGAAAGREGFWFSAVGWAPRRDGVPARFAFERVSADFRELEVWCWSEGACQRVWHERDERWIGGPARDTRWSEDGSVLLVGSESTPLSTTPGRCQVFAVDPASGAARQVTEVAGEVARFRPLEGGGLLVEASGADPARREVLLLPSVAALAADAPPPLRYPLPEGWNEGARATADGGRVVALHEELLRPGELWTATPGEDGRAAPLTRTVPAAFEAVRWIRPERVELVAEDGARVRAAVYLPRGVALSEPGPPRAAIVFVHGAGYLQNVADSMTRYPLNALFHSRLADLGYPVIDVDYRGSAGYGRDFRTDVQYHLGGRDLADIHLVVDHLAARGLVDPERVGVYGGSYGGFLALMALATAPERWAAGAALRSVTDWRTYHPRYVQPRLGRPSTHPEAYARSSPIDLVDGLVDPVLLLHGLLDSNVFAQDSIRFIEELIERGREFDAMLYPSQGHAFEDGPHWLDEYRRIERFLLTHLGPPLSPAP